MRPFAVYPASFDGSTLSYHRFGEDGGRLDGIIGPAMAVAAGAPTPTDRGYLYAIGDQHQALLPGQPIRTQGTLECWHRADNPENGWGYPLVYRLNADNYLLLQTRRQVGTGIIRATLRIGAVNAGQATWSGADVRALLDSPEMIHIAGSFDSVAGYCRLFVNGVQRGEDLAGILQLPLGDYRVLSPYFHTVPVGLIDEIRVSSVSRYVGGANGTRYFTPARFQDGRRLGLRGPEILATAGGIP